MNENAVNLDTVPGTDIYCKDANVSHRTRLSFALITTRELLVRTRKYYKWHFLTNKPSRESKVPNLDVPLAGDENVLALEVPVRYFPLVEVHQSTHELRRRYDEKSTIGIMGYLNELRASTSSRARTGKDIKHAKVQLAARRCKLRNPSHAESARVSWPYVSYSALQKSIHARSSIYHTFIIQRWYRKKKIH
jgi:hypothetical protein